jgi:excisionase family DNA binding protein
VSPYAKRTQDLFAARLMVDKYHMKSLNSQPLTKLRGVQMEVLNLEEACSFLRVAKPTLYKYVRTGQIPAYKMGRVWRFDKDALEGWVKLQVRKDTEARASKGAA